MSESGGQLEERRGVLGWVVRHPKVTIALVLFVLLALILLAMQQSADRALAGRIAAIKARGEPISIKDLISHQTRVADESNRILQLEIAGKQIHDFDIPEDKVAFLPIVGTAIKRPRTGAPLPNEQLSASQWFLQQNAAALDSVHRACRLKDGNLGITWASPAVNLPYHTGMAEMRAAAKALALEAVVAAEAGDSDRAAVALQDMCRSTQWSTDGVLLHYLIQIAIDSLTLDHLERTINRCSLGEDALKRLEALVGEMKVQELIRQSLINERVIYLDTIQWARTGKGAGGLSPGANALRFVPLILSWDAAAGLDAYADLIDAVSGPADGRLARVKAIEGCPAMVAWYSVLSKMLMPALSRAVELGFRTDGQARAMIAVIAAERFRLATGHWPDALSELVPVYMETVPADPIDGKPIRYAVIPEGIKTWTIAGEGHDEDNGGDVQRLEGHYRGMDNGWVILNPELRGRAAAEGKAGEKNSAATTRATKG